ncbi:MAG: aminotransferase class I/II-fold pyridoxal phosphate-dependent enzyme, partial [Planctomycetota bacterium]
AVDVDAEITVTAGCTEAIGATAMGLLEPGDRVVVFEPYYDCYPAALALAGAEPVFVALRQQADGSFGFDGDELRSACAGARAVLVNTPHNPTGKVFTAAELQVIAEAALEHDLLVLADEVYDQLVYEGEHVSIASLDGMRERTVTMGSLGKTFSLTGWKVGWTIASPELTRAVRSAHQFLIYAVATPLQHAAAVGIREGDAYIAEQREMFRSRRDLLGAELAKLGFTFAPTQGGYFILADHTAFSGPRGITSDVELCHHLIEHAGVATIPPSAFYANKELGRPLLRFAFCKTEGTLRAAVERLSAMA